MSIQNQETVRIEMESISCNESFARMVAAVFAARFDPTINELEDVKTAVSEAVTNSIIHGYDKQTGKVIMILKRTDNELTIIIEDTGCGIENIKQAMEPMFTTKPEDERSGMGFSFMEAFMDKLEVVSAVGEGTTVTMKKTFGTAIKEEEFVEA